MLEGQSSGQLKAFFKTLVSKLPTEKITSLFSKKKVSSNESLEKPEPPANVEVVSNSSDTQKQESSEGAPSSSEASSSDDASAIDGSSPQETSAEAVTPEDVEHSKKTAEDDGVPSSSDTSDSSEPVKTAPVFDKEHLVEELRPQLLAELKEQLAKEFATSQNSDAPVESGSDFGKIKQFETKIEQMNGTINEQSSKIKEYSEKIDDFEKKTEEFNLAMYELTTKKFNPFITQVNKSSENDSSSNDSSSQQQNTGSSNSSSDNSMQQPVQQQQPQQRQQQQQPQPQQYQQPRMNQQPVQQQSQQQRQQYAPAMPQQQNYPQQSNSQQMMYEQSMPSEQHADFYDQDVASQDSRAYQSYSEPAYAHQPTMGHSHHDSSDPNETIQAINVQDSLSGEESSLDIPRQNPLFKKKFLEQANKLPNGINSGLYASEKISIEDTIDMPSEDSDEIRERILLEERWNDANMKEHPEQLRPKMEREDIKSLLGNFLHKHDHQKKHVSRKKTVSSHNQHSPARTQQQSNISSKINALERRHAGLQSRMSPEQKGKLQVRLALARMPNDLNVLKRTQDPQMLEKIAQSLDNIEHIVNKQ